MSREFEQWVYKQASIIDPYYKDCKPELPLSRDVLLACMWAINREVVSPIIMSEYGFNYKTKGFYFQLMKFAICCFQRIIDISMRL